MPFMSEQEATKELSQKKFNNMFSSTLSMYLSGTAEPSSTGSPHFMHIPLKEPGCAQNSFPGNGPAQQSHIKLRLEHGRLNFQAIMFINKVPEYPNFQILRKEREREEKCHPKIKDNETDKLTILKQQPLIKEV